MNSNGELAQLPFDVIVVGGGAAGCVLAGRLSEVPTQRVLLIEAGPDVSAENEHPDIRDTQFFAAFTNPEFTWNHLIAEMSPEIHEGAPYTQGYGLGGGSNINGMGADRGQPADYSEWRDLGASGWGWEDVLPYFRKLEQDQDFSGPMHGRDGPIPIRRIAPSQWAPFAAAVGQAVQRRGYRLFEDFNADMQDGLSSFPMSCTTEQRVSAAKAYLPKSVRSRSNLTLLTGTKVERLISSGGRVNGVLVHSAKGLVEIRGRETVVTCGALQTPALLMRSGVGPGAQLQHLGIPVVQDLPGVGRNLQNHPTLYLTVHLPKTSMQATHARPVLQNILRYSSGHPGCAQHDMLLYPFNRGSWHSLGGRIGALIVYVNKAYSRGSVELTSTDSAVSPRIRFNLLSDPRDFERLVSGLQFALDILADPAVARVRNEAFTADGRLVARLGRRNRRNQLQAWAIAKVLDNGTLRRILLRNDFLDVCELARDAQALQQFVRTRAHAAYHVCGTCKMGAPSDPQAVVGPTGRVLGVQGLRVADASVFPTIPCANTHLTVLMTAEKMADHIKSDWQASLRSSA